MRMINKMTILITAMASFLLLIFSCNVSVNSMYYKQQMNRMHVGTDSDNDGGGTDLPEVDENAIQELFDKAEIEKDSLFPAANFDNWVFYMTDIDSDNICTYKFGEGTWVEQGDYEVYSDGPDIGGNQINAAWDLKYYRYKTRADRWKAEGEQNFDPELDDVMSQLEERFYFFKFTGSAKAGTKLDNSMLCVDTYTKFVFNYSEPGEITSILGNKVPSKWQDWADPNTTVGNNHTEAYPTPFYLYDPIGYVEANGDVIYYDWANEKIIDTNYSPSLNSGFTAVAERAQDKPGKSPYLPDGSSIGGDTNVVDEPEAPVPNNTPPDTDISAKISIRAKYIKNINMGEQDSLWPKGILAVFGHEMKVQFEGHDEEKLAYTRCIGNGYLASEMHSLVHGSESKLLYGGFETQPTVSHTVETAADGRFVLLLDLRKYTRDGLKTENECILITPQAKLVFEYNKDSDSIMFIKREKGLGENVAISGYQDGFSVSRDNEKDLVLTFTKEGRSVEICFTIGLTNDGDDGTLPGHVNMLKTKLKSIENKDIHGHATWGNLFPGEKDVDFGYFNYQIAVNGDVLAKYKTTVAESVHQNKACIYVGKKMQKEINLFHACPHKFENYSEVSATLNGDISLEIDLAKHDGHYGGVAMGVFKEETNECPISTFEAPVILHFDSTNQTLDIPSLDSSSLPEGVSCSVPAGFTLAKGETKDFPITFTVNRPDLFCEGDVVITYELNWQ